MSNYEQQQGALERLGIPVETIPPETILTSGQARSIRFRVSQPRGYAFGDVESFIFEYLLPTLEWYANALHQRDLAVHKLGEMIDILEVDQLNLKAQLDNKQYNEALSDAIAEDEAGDDVDYLLERIKTLEDQLRNGEAPEGEFYSREEVEQYIATAEEEAVAATAADYQTRMAEAVASAVAAKEAELRNQQPDLTGYYTAEELSAAVAAKEAEIQAQQPDLAEYYTADQVEKILQENAGYSEEQMAQLVEEAKASVLTSGTYYTEDELSKAVAAATANVPASVSGYTEEELQQHVSQAVAEKEAEILASLPANVTPVDPMDEITDEGDLSLRAEVKTLRDAVKKFEVYTEELETYIAQIEGVEPDLVDDTPRTPDGRPLPKIRPEDL